MHDTPGPAARPDLTFKPAAVLGLLSLAAIMSLPVGVGAAGDRAKPLNVLLITADDLGLQLSCYGDPVADSPHLDELAQRGVRFRTAYVTQASCSPSRSSILTGLYPHGNGQYGLTNARVGFQVHPKLLDRLLPNVLKRHGYRTGLIGKLHVDPHDQFDFDVRHREGFGTRDVRTQARFAREFIVEAGDAPWFLMFNVFDPHVARERFPEGAVGAQYFPDQVLGLPTRTVSADDVSPWPWQQIDTPEQRKKIAGFYNCIQRVDAAIGLLMDGLDESGHRDDTLIIFLSDHGPPFARGKTSCYEAGLRVPFLVQWPGVSEAHASDRLVSSVDIYPTVLDAAGIEVSGASHGRSLRPTLRPDDDAPWREALAGEFHYHGRTFFPRRAIRDQRYKLIHNLRAGEVTAPHQVDGDTAYEVSTGLPEDHPARLAMERLKNPPKWELYDLASDPNELRNRVGDSSLVDVEARLRQQLAAWQEQTGDPFVDADFFQSIEAKFHRPK